MTINFKLIEAVFINIQEQLGSENLDRVFKNIIKNDEAAKKALQKSNNHEEIEQIKKAIRDYQEILKEVEHYSGKKIEDLKYTTNDSDKSHSFFYLSLAIIILLAILIFKNS